jgi:ATP-dependent DNA helicase RecG
MNFKELHKTGESQHLEFKTSFGKEVVETVAAFSNASGGTILIGIDQNGKVKGVSINEEIRKEWVNTIKQATQPQIFPEVIPYELEGKTIVALKVQEYPIKPVGCKGKYFKRVGASNHLVPLDEIVEMQLYSINSSFDSFSVTETLSDLDMDLVKKFFGQLGNTGRVTLNDDPLVNLRKMGLLKEGQLTFAALLLFGEHRTGIHIGRFKTQDVIIDDMLIKSPLAIAVDEAMNFIKKNISLRYEFTGELRRKEIWQFPLPVIRELLLNAVIHKDYRNPTDIMIKIFDNSIQFVNPGGLMGGLNPEDLMKGNYIAMHRNKLLAEAFYLRGDIEKFGTGFFRIQTELKDSPEVGLKLEALNGFTRSHLEVISQDTPQDTPQDKGLITRQVSQDTPQDTPQDTKQVTEQVTEQVKDLIDNIKEQMTRVEIQKRLNLKNREHFRAQYLQPGLAAGVIEMTIPDKPNSRYQKYRLTEKGEKIKQTLKRDERVRE